MTVLRTSNAPVGINDGKPISTAYDVNPWVIPSDWVTFTDPDPSEQKVIGTVAIFDQDSNYLAVAISITDSTQYTVDWGDGTSTNHTSGSVAEKNYTWSSISSGTLTSGGYRQAVVTITPTTAGKTFSNLQLSRRHSSLAAGNTTATSPWLNISISAPNASIDFTSNSSLSTAERIACNMLEQIKILSSSQSNTGGLFRSLIALQSVVYNNSATINSMDTMFGSCRSLQYAPFFNTTGTTNFFQMFNLCTSLKYVPLYNTSSATTMQSMFNSCASLQDVPLFDTSSVGNMSSMFNGCVSLQTIPLFNTANATNMGSMFNGCTSLVSVPLLNTASNASMNSMFTNCTSLKTVPLFNTVSVSNMASTFSGCTSLESVPLFTTGLVISMTNMFSNCTSLQSYPVFNTINLQSNATSMFSNCSTLREIAELNLSKIPSAATNLLGLGNATVSNAAASLGRAKLVGNKWSQTFQNCRMGATQLDEMYTALATLNPAVTNASGTGTTVTYTVGTGSISPFVVGRTVTVTGVDPVAYNITGTVASVNAGAGTFTITNAATGTYVSGGIASITSDRTITVTNNPGVATDDPTIATNKGWVVTG